MGIAIRCRHCRETSTLSGGTEVQYLDCEWFVIDRSAVIRLHPSCRWSSPVRRRTEQAVGGNEDGRELGIKLSRCYRSRLPTSNHIVVAFVQRRRPQGR